MLTSSVPIFTLPFDAPTETCKAVSNTLAVDAAVEIEPELTFMLLTSINALDEPMLTALEAVSRFPVDAEVVRFPEPIKTSLLELIPPSIAIIAPLYCTPFRKLVVAICPVNAVDVAVLAAVPTLDTKFRSTQSSEAKPSGFSALKKAGL